jgi:hypothetical protein
MGKASAGAFPFFAWEFYAGQACFLQPATISINGLPDYLPFSFAGL